MRKPRVLLLINRWYPDGGVENFIQQLISETGGGVDYTIGSLITNVSTEAKCRKLGPIIPSGKIEAMFTEGNRIADTLRKGCFDAVHIQASNGSAFYLAHLAKKAGIPKRIVHSHNGGSETSSHRVRGFIGCASTAAFSGAATDLWACSENAGTYLFGDRPFSVFLNGIDIDRFAFSWRSREEVRKRLGVAPSSFLLGSIGRIAYQKNPLFQVGVFAELLKIVPNARFCMVGSGNMEEELDAQIERLGVRNALIRVSRTSDSASFYSAFDALIFPPLFEGLSFVGIEGQCSGLPIYASEALPGELDITERITFRSLDEGVGSWAGAIADDMGRFPIEERSTFSNRLRNAGFDSAVCFRRIAASYEGCLR